MKKLGFLIGFGNVCAERLIKIIDFVLKRNKHILMSTREFDFNK